jgi:hypothetical protein
MSWFTRLFRGGCALCEPLENITSRKIVECSQLKEEVERLSTALRAANAISAERVAFEQNQLQAASFAVDLERLKRDLMSVTDAPSVPAAIGVLLAWRAWAEQGPRLQRENFTLRAQLNSVAMQNMGRVSVMGVPLTDAAPRTGSNDN